MWSSLEISNSWHQKCHQKLVKQCLFLWLLSSRPVTSRAVLCPEIFGIAWGVALSVMSCNTRHDTDVPFPTVPVTEQQQTSTPRGSCSACEAIRLLFWNPQIHCRLHTGPYVPVARPVKQFVFCFGTRRFIFVFTQDPMCQWLGLWSNSSSVLEPADSLSSSHRTLSETSSVQLLLPSFHLLCQFKSGNSKLVPVYPMRHIGTADVLLHFS
jgi:hypothetical protein